MLFHKTPTSISPKREEEILDFWAKKDVFKQSIRNREGRPDFVFFEGPPTANGMPHPGHVLTKAMKDLIPRYKTMCGFRVGRKAGWDTHGLPVELEVEKQLGISCKQDIEKFGIENFIKKCRESVFKYEKEWRRMCERGGFWVDMDDPYITCTNQYIETVWWMLGQFWKSGLLYEGHKVVPYCPRCGTALSSHEVAQGYAEAEDPSVFVRFAVKGQADTFFLVWTTTPWTLISNVALAVGKEVDYARVKYQGQTLIMAQALVEKVLKEGYEILSTCKGSDLVNMDYEQLYQYVKPKKRAHYVIPADFVSTEDGTGIVHIAPAFGEDDYRVGKAHDLPVIQPVDLNGCFTDEVTPWKGTFVKKADPAIIKDMKQKGTLLFASTIKHTYPFCWRCESPLLYYARHSWFIKTTAFKEEVLANNEKINWFPDYIKNGRFKNFLDNMIDWAISRDRYWGTPLPIWQCECGKQECIDSVQALKSRGKNVPADIELHKPYVDAIEMDCPDCGKSMKRVPEVIDCWFDSGAMHTAQWHYPFENQETFKKNFPADFICEAVDQTRGWFYSLLITSTFLHKAPAYKNVVVLGLICDKNGVKMSKSKGNVIDVMGLFEKYGADAVRWALYSGTAPWNSRRFYEGAVSDSISRFLGTLQNVHSFLVMYANTDNINPLMLDVPVAQRSELDRWILSRYQKTVIAVREALDTFEITHATQTLETFVDDLSNWYVRRSRRRFWASDLTPDKKAAFRTLWELLVGVAKLIAPFTPFMAEDLYLNLVGAIDAKAPASVHLADFPQADPALIDEALEKNMGFVRTVVQLGRAARNEANLKVRQPLAEMKVVAPEAWQADVLKRMQALIDEELNVKAVTPVAAADDLVKYVIKPNFRTLGKGPFKGLIPKIKAYLETADGAAVQKSLGGGGYAFTLDNQEVKLTAEDVEVTRTASGDFAVQAEGSLTIALDKTLTRPLVLEGLARELVNKIQFMRKEKGLDISDRIAVTYQVGEQQNAGDLSEAILQFGDYIRHETLALKMKPVSGTETGTEWILNGIPVRLDLTKETAQ